MSNRKHATGSASRILDAAEALVQTRGFNGFSYGDIAAQLGVTSASLHYHFRGKAELGEALIARYTERFGEALASIDGERDDAPAKLDAYARIYTEVLRLRRMCLCGMLAADYDTLPDAMRGAVVRFFDANERWLSGVLEQGRANGTLEFTGSAGEVAQSIVGGLEGALLIARPYNDVSRFEMAAERLIAGLTQSPARHR